MRRRMPPRPRPREPKGGAAPPRAQPVDANVVKAIVREYERGAFGEDFREDRLAKIAVLGKGAFFCCFPCLLSAVHVSTRDRGLRISLRPFPSPPPPPSRTVRRVAYCACCLVVYGAAVEQQQYKIGDCRQQTILVSVHPAVELLDPLHYLYTGTLFGAGRGCCFLATRTAENCQLARGDRIVLAAGVGLPLFFFPFLPFLRGLPKNSPGSLYKIFFFTPPLLSAEEPTHFCDATKVVCHMKTSSLRHPPRPRHDTSRVQTRTRRLLFVRHPLLRLTPPCRFCASRRSVEHRERFSWFFFVVPRGFSASTKHKRPDVFRQIRFSSRVHSRLGTPLRIRSQRSSSRVVGNPSRDLGG